MARVGFYQTKKWRRFRDRIAAQWIANELPCAFCGKRIEPHHRSDLDHIETLKDRPDLAFDPENVRLLHGWCHSRRTMRDKAAASRGFYLGTNPDGSPLDPRHPANEKGRK